MWQPYARLADTPRILTAIDAVARDLEQRFNPARFASAEPSSKWPDYTLVEGMSAAALFFHYRYKLSGDSTDLRRRDGVLDEMLRGLENASMFPNLFSGFVGLGWVFAHALDADDARLACDPIDEAVFEELMVPVWPGDFELLRGLVGLGVYSIERADSIGVRQMLERTVAQLRSIAVQTESGSAWLSPYESLPQIVQHEHPKNRISTGLAHGQAAVVSLLARVAQLPT